MPRAPLAAALTASLAAACAHEAATTPPAVRYVVEPASGPKGQASLFVDRTVIDKAGETWTFRGFVPNEGCNAAMTAKIESFAKEWRDGSVVATSDHSKIGGSNPHHDLLIACSEHRRAWIWSTEWIELRSQEFTSCKMPDLDFDGCADLVIAHPQRRIQLCSSTGRLIELL